MVGRPAVRAMERVSSRTISPGREGLRPLGSLLARGRLRRAARGTFRRRSGTGKTAPFSTRVLRMRPAVLSLASKPWRRMRMRFWPFPTWDSRCGPRARPRPPAPAAPGASSRFAAPSLRFGPADDPPFAAARVCCHAGSALPANKRPEGPRRPRRAGPDPPRRRADRPPARVRGPQGRETARLPPPPGPPKPEFALARRRARIPDRRPKAPRSPLSAPGPPHRNRRRPRPPNVATSGGFMPTRRPFPRKLFNLADYRNLTMATTTPTMAPVCIHKAR